MSSGLFPWKLILVRFPGLSFICSFCVRVASQRHTEDVRQPLPA